MQTLEMILRAVRAVNTMGGMQAFTICITCSLEDILFVKESLTQCGISNQEVGVIHSSDETKGRCMHSYIDNKIFRGCF